MLFYKNFQSHFNGFFSLSILTLGLLVSFTLSCSAQQSEEKALKSLRQMTKDGKLPSESVVANLEYRFSRTNTGALAKLLRARIRLENGNPMGAAQLLNSDVFRQKTKLADYALWLRGKALIKAGQQFEAHKVFSELIQTYPNSMRAREAKLMWAESLLNSGQAAQVPRVLQSLLDKNDAEALLLVAKSYERNSNQTQSINYYRKVYFYGAGTKASREAKTKLEGFGQDLAPQTPEEILTRADNLFSKRNYSEAARAYDEYIRNFSRNIKYSIQLKRLTSYAKSRQMSQAGYAFSSIPISVKEKEEGFYQIAVGYAKTRQWEQVKATIAEMRGKYPRSKWTPKALMDVGMIARDQRRKLDESYFLKTAVISYPNSIDVTKAQFELAWLEHQKKNFAVSSRMLTEHLARYVHKDNSYRGRSAYWAARDSEKAGKIKEACALYDGTAYRYGANWYGYLSLQRLQVLRRRGQCQTPPNFPANSLIPKAVANLKVVTVAAETATEKELAIAEKAEQLSTIGLFDWAIEELRLAKKTANNSPKINLALAKHYRLKGDNVRALLALKNSYPDYSQMFPEEMGREEWDIFYPLIHWNDIKFWANRRSLDPYQVAGLIRQETIFDPNAKSSANAYGLMQLLIPTARNMARKYSSVSSSSIYGSRLYDPKLNIELGTAYMREQLSRYGRIEYMSVAYNAGPARVIRWRRELPLQMDEFVEEIPFTETRGYVKGIIRNSAQYRRLYDMNGNFKSNVGSRPLRGQIDSKSKEQFAKENPEILVERERKLAE